MFAVLFVLTITLVGDTGSTAQEGAELLPDAGDRLASAYLTGAVSTLFLLAFFAWLRDLIVTTAPARTVLAALSLAPAAAAAALFIGSLSVLFGLGEAAGDTGVSAELAAFGTDAQYGFLVGGAMLTGFAVGCASLALQRTRALPGWLCWVGIVVAVLQLVAFTFLPILLLLVWVLVASVLLAVRPPDRTGVVVQASAA